jgi:hypothetical protein
LEYQLMNGDPDVDVMTSEGIASSISALQRSL